MKLTLRQLTPEERTLVDFIASLLGVSSAWCLKHYLSNGETLYKKRIANAQA